MTTHLMLKEPYLQQSIHYLSSVIWITAVCYIHIYKQCVCVCVCVCVCARVCVSECVGVRGGCPRSFLLVDFSLYLHVTLTLFLPSLCGESGIISFKPQRLNVLNTQQSSSFSLFSLSSPSSSPPPMEGPSLPLPGVSHVSVP